MTKILRRFCRTGISSQLLKRFLIGAIIICLLITIYLTSELWRNNITRGRKSSNGNIHSTSLFRIERRHPLESAASEVSIESHKLCVIVPFRDRYEELMTFGPYIHRYLNLKKISHEIIVVKQVDQFRFNRAALINVGFLYSTQHNQKDTQTHPTCDYIVMHDVDLLPLNNDLPYEYPDESNVVVHVAAPGLHPKYDYPTFIGGILIVPKSIFGLVNGMSNLYWGWGLEDDEFFVRLKQNSIQVVRPKNLKTNKTNTFRHIHSGKKRPRDMAKCFDQWKKTRRRDRITGLNNVTKTAQRCWKVTQGQGGKKSKLNETDELKPNESS